MVEKLDTASRFGVFMAHKGRCFWCAECLSFREAQVDHIIPRDAAANEELMTQIISDYGLDQNFEVESFENWVCSCPKCNRQKSAHQYDPSPAMLHSLSIAGIFAEIARENAAKIRSDPNKAKVLAQVAQAVEEGHLQLADLKRLVEDLAAMGYRSAESQIHWIYVTDTLKFHTDGVMGQVATFDEHDKMRFWSLRPTNSSLTDSEILLDSMMKKRHPDRSGT